MKNKKVLSLVAGSSGGHILPALQLAKKWLKQNSEGKVIFFCGDKELDKKIIEKNLFLHKIIYLRLDNFPGKKLWLYPKFIIQLIITFLKSLYYLIKFMPYKIIGTGGYISIPVCFAAKLIKVKIELYELNVVPGKAVKALIPIVNKIFVTFEGSKLFLKNRVKDFINRCELSEYPIRFTSKDKFFEKESIIKSVNKKFFVTFSLNRKTIFLLGGSQGSIFLNKIFKDWLVKNKNILDKIQIIHQVGIKDQTDWKSFYSLLNLPAIVFSFDEEIKNYYLISDLIISRAGAGTLFELEFFKKRSIIIPLKSEQTDHQVDNASEMNNKYPDLFFVQDQDLINKDFSIFERELFKGLNLIN